MTISGTVDYDGYYDSITIIDSVTIQAQYMGVGSPGYESSGCASPGHGIPLTDSPGGGSVHLSPSTYSGANSIIFITMAATNDILLSSLTERITTILTEDVTNNGLIFGCADNNVYSLSTDGYDLNIIDTTGYPIHQNLVIDSNKNIYYCANNEFHCNMYSNATSGSGGRRWEHEQISGAYFNSSPVLNSDGSIVYIGTDNYLYAISTSDGNILTSYKDVNNPTQRFSYPIVDPLQNHVYVGTNFTTDSTGNLYSINMIPLIGWNTPSITDFIVNSAYEDSMAIGADGTVYVGFTSTRNEVPGLILGFNGTTGDIVSEWYCPGRDITMFAPTIGSDGTLYACSNTQISALI